MKRYLLLQFKNDAGKRQTIRFDHFNDQLTGDEIKAEMNKIIDTKILEGKNGPMSEITEAKIVEIQEEVLV